MDDINWYADASLAGGGHVYCSGSLAQCVRRWMRLSGEEKASVTVTVRDRAGSKPLSSEQVEALAARPGLNRV